MQTQTNGTACFGYGLGGSGAANFIEVCTQASIRDNQWHHLAGVFTGTATQMYEDGVLQNVFSSTALPVTNNRDVHIGMSWGGGSPTGFFRGLIDEWRYFNRALSQAEIQSIVDADSARECKPCVDPPSGIARYPADNDLNDIIGDTNWPLQGGTTFATGDVGQAFSFDGTGYVDTSDSINNPDRNPATSCNRRTGLCWTDAESRPLLAQTVETCWRDERRVVPDGTAPVPPGLCHRS